MKTERLERQLIHQFFPDLKDEKLLAEIEKFAVLKEFKAGEVLLRQGHDVVSIPFVLNGHIKVILEARSDREIMLYQIDPGDTCVMSIAALFELEKSKVSAIVDKSALALILPGNQVFGWITQYPQWTRLVFNLYNKRLSETMALVEAIVFQKIDLRLWQHLLKKAEVSQVQELEITHQELALELGTVREVVSRLLQRLKKDGKVALSRGKVKILVQI